MVNHCGSQLLIMLLFTGMLLSCSEDLDERLTDEEADAYLQRMVEESLTEKKVFEKYDSVVIVQTYADTAKAKEIKREPLPAVAVNPTPKPKLTAELKSVQKKDTLVKPKIAKTVKTDSTAKKQVVNPLIQSTQKQSVQNSGIKDSSTVNKKKSKQKTPATVTETDSSPKPPVKVIEPLPLGNTVKPIPVPQIPGVKQDTAK